MFAAPFLVLTALASSTFAIIGPVEPSGTSVFREGQDCSIKWTPDTEGAWTHTKIELMSGDNFHMVHVKDVAIVNGSDPATTSYTYPCFAVEPNSLIYFYQFTSPDALGNTTWTTRFTIAGPTGGTTPPANPTQPGTNDPIPWGVGALQDPSQADASTTTGATGITASAGPTTNLPTTSAPTGTGSKTTTATTTAPTATKSGAATGVSGSSFAVAAAAALIGSMML